MIRALLLVFLGAASFAAVYVAMAPDGKPVAERTTAETAQPPRPVAAVTAKPASAPVDPGSMAFELRPGTEVVAKPQAQPVREVRNVTPENMTAAPETTGALTRVESPAPAPATAPREARTQRLYNPVVVSAGIIKLGDEEIRLAGVAAPQPDQSCGEGAAAWPCGRMARAALRSFIRGRAIECDVPAGTDRIPERAHCLVGGADIAQWLVAQGWAKRDGDSYANVENAARAAKLGLWGERRPDQADAVASSG